MSNNCICANTLVSIDEFNTYSGNYEDSDEMNNLKVQLLQSATSVVEEYLEYKLVSGLHIDEHIGFNNSKIYLDNKPVVSINAVTINGEDFFDYDFNCESIYRTDGNVFKDQDKVVVEYETNLNSAPPLVKTTILRIATLMLMEAGENIGITGKSAPDGMSRTFLNYSNYQKYLEPLRNYRVFKL